MSFILPQTNTEAGENIRFAMAKIGTKEEDKGRGFEKVPWIPTEEESAAMLRVRMDFATAWETMWRPRQEFNDLSVIERDQMDAMAFNTYQPGNGEPLEGDAANSWRSNAIRPVERAKVFSMAGHTAERLGFVKVEGSDRDSMPDEDGSMVVNDLMDFCRANWFGPEWWLHVNLQQQVSPAAIVHVEHAVVTRPRKVSRNADGTWNAVQVVDESLSGIRGQIVPTDQLYIENFFEKDIQRQGFLIKRTIVSHSIAEALYGKRKNWQFVRRGMQCLFNDANQAFYWCYDSALRGMLAEIAVYYSKSDGGLQLEMVNGVLVSEPDAPLPREDGLYPFAKGYKSWIRDNCFYGKSTVFEVSHDANIINTLTPVMVDGALLDRMPPTKYIGSDVIASDVIVPGMTTTLKDPNSKLEPILSPTNSASLMQAIGKIEESVDDIATTQVFPNGVSGHMTAYAISSREQQLSQKLAPFMSECVGLSVQLTRLVLGDVLQHFTVADVDASVGAKDALRYKTFLVDKQGTGGGSKVKRRRISFERLPDLSDKQKALDASYQLLAKQGKIDAETEQVQADPVRLRQRKYRMLVTDDVLKPKSDALKFQENMATFDKAIAAKEAGANVDLDKLTEKLLFAVNPVTARDPHGFMTEPPPQGQPEMAPAGGGKPPMPGANPKSPEPAAPMAFPGAV